MATGHAGSEPTGIAGDCFFVLGMYDNGKGMTVRELHEAIISEHLPMGWPIPTRAQVRGALHATLKKRGLADHGVGRASQRWSQTPYGLKMLEVWVGADEPEPAKRRRPSGLGWPAIGQFS